MPPRSSKPTLATLAAAVGVSRATASNAFNRPEKLSAALRATIMKTAEELGYSGPDPTAASLRRGRVGAVGVIVPDRLSYAFSDPAVVATLDGLAEELEQDGTGILLLPGGDALRGPTAAGVRNASVDAFVVYGGVDDQALAAALDLRRLPVVVLGGTRRRRIHVDLDEESGCRALTEHLVALGHRRFGVVTLRTRSDGVSGPMSPDRRRSVRFEVTRRRLDSVLTTLSEHGIDEAAVPVYEVDHNHPSEGAVAAGWLLDQPHPPTAIICQSDQIAIGALDAARARNRRVPQDVSIGGFDDIDRAAQCQPPLTTVRQPLQERGRVAGRALRRALDGASVRGSTLPVELIVRASTGRPPRDRRGR